jgi:hypothetical protein
MFRTPRRCMFSTPCLVHAIKYLRHAASIVYARHLHTLIHTIEQQPTSTMLCCKRCCAAASTDNHQQQEAAKQHYSYLVACKDLAIRLLDLTQLPQKVPECVIDSVLNRETHAGLQVKEPSDKPVVGSPCTPLGLSCAAGELAAPAGPVGTWKRDWQNNP